MATGSADNSRLASGKSAAKNRIVQQRYRERQKDKLKGYEEQLEGLRLRLATLEVEKHGLEDRNRLLEKLARLTEDNIAESRSINNVDEVSLWQRRETAAAVASVMNIVNRGRAPHLSAREAGKISYAELCAADTTHVRNIAELMLAGAVPGSAAQQELEDYVLQYMLDGYLKESLQLQRCAWIQLANTYSLQVAAKLMAAEQDQEPPIFKPSVVTALALTSDQKREVLQARRQTLEACEGIKKVRRKAADDMNKSFDAAEPEVEDATTIDHMLVKMRANDSFRDSLAAELHLLCRFWQTCMEILTPLQEARALMDIFPDAWLDVWMLASYLEAEQQGTLEAWLATFTTAEGIRSFMQNYPPKHLHSHTPSLDQPGLTEPGMMLAPQALEGRLFRTSAGNPKTTTAVDMLAGFERHESDDDFFQMLENVSSVR